MSDSNSFATVFPQVNLSLLLINKRKIFYWDLPCIKSVHSVLAHLSYNSSPLIILSALSRFATKKYEDVILLPDRRLSKCQTPAMHTD